MNWRCVETIPRDGNIVILHTVHGVVSTWFDCETSEWVCFDDRFVLDEVEVARGYGWLWPHELGIDDL